MVHTDAIFTVQRSAARGAFDFGWLQTQHSFSFGDYHDPQNMQWGALRVFNDDTVAPGEGFPTHPHRSMEIVTYVLRGQLEHRDSLGHHGIVSPGGIQYVSAGTGVQHSEFNASSSQAVHFVQMWVLPRASGGAPGYGQHDFDAAQRHNAWLAVASGQHGIDAPVTLNADASVRVAHLDDAAIATSFDPARCGFLFVADGSVTANGAFLETGDAVRFRGVELLEVSGSGELVLWDVPALDGAAR